MSKNIHPSLLKAYTLMATAKAMTDLFEANRDVTQTYVHATSRGHEAIQLACSLQLKSVDYPTLITATMPCCWE